MAASDKTEIAELFSFITHEREDVRKMALDGLAGHSTNEDIVEYLVAHPEDVHKLIGLLEIKYIKVLGTVLLTLINLAAAASSFTEVAVEHKVVSRTMRLLTGLRGEPATQFTNSLLELALMLLNNVTASHPNAVVELLELDDEDLAGYSFSKLKTHLDACDPDAERDVRLWYWKLCLNATQVPRGQDIVVADEDWWGAVVESISEVKDTPIAIADLSIKIARNCCAHKQTMATVAKTGLGPACVHRLCNAQRLDGDAQLEAAEVIAALMTHEEGVKSLEEINAKGLLTTALETEPLPVTEAAKSFIERNVLPFLDDVQDIYVMNNDDE